MEEELLQAWISLTMLVRENRCLESLSYNEMVVLRILNEKDGCSQNELCKAMSLYKSQMNGLITSLEEKGLVERSVDPLDKRRKKVCLKDRDVYLQEHQEIIGIMQYLVSELGQEKAEMLTKLMFEAKTILEKGRK